MLRHLSLLVYSAIAFSGFSQATLFSDDFESGSAAWTATDDLLPNFWVVDACAGNGTSAPGTSSAYVSNGTSFGGCTPGLTYSNAGSGTLMATYYTTVDGTCATNLQLNFDYLIDGVVSEDIGQVVYSTDGGSSWIQVGSDLTSSATWTTSSLSLPASLDGTSFLLGFRFVYNNATINGSPLAIDNVVVTGTDTVNPAMVCLSSVDVSVNSSCQGIAGDYTKDLVTLSDNCTDSALITVTQDIPEFSVFASGPGGTETVTLTATDEAGNSTQCAITINIIDDTPPSLTCPPDTNIYVDANCDGLVGNYLGDATVSDNCTSFGNIILSQNPPMGTIINGATVDSLITITATDESGNVATCQFLARTIDTLVATIVCPADTNLYANGSCQYTLPDFTGDAIAADNCVPSAALTVSQSPAPGTTMSSDLVITLTVSGGQPNVDQSCNFNALLVDTISPSIVCPVAATEYVDASCNLSLPDYTSVVVVNDNCGGSLSIAQSPAPGSLQSGTGNVPVTMTVTDASGNTKSCVFNLPVVDTISPTVTCPGAQMEPGDANCFATLGNYVTLASASDNCSAVFTYGQSPAPGTIFSGTTTVTITATDEAGNSGSCTFDVSVQDVINPTITCPSNTTLPASATCSAVLPDYSGSAVVNDNCTASGNLVFTQVPAVSSTISGTQTVSLTVTDQAGNMASCNFDVTVIDQTGPAVNCPSNQTIIADASCSGTLADYTGMITTSDNCSALANLTVQQSPASGTVINSNTAITITVTDEASNSNSCVFNVLLQDTISPLVTCPGDQTVSIISGCQYLVPDLSSQVGGSDNCSSLGNMIISQNPAVGSMQNGITAVIVTLTDEQGNSATCITNLLPDDVSAPGITCPNPAPVNNGVSCDFTLPFYGSMASVLDNCSNYTIDQTPVQGTIVNPGITSITLVVTDAGGNTDQCTFDLTVLETEAPVITCPSDISTCDPFITYLDPVYSDNCGASLAQTDGTGLTSGMNFPVGVTMLEYTAVDSSGNMQTCTFNVEVLDFPSSANIVDDTVWLCDQSSTVITADPITSGSGLWTLESGQGTFNNQFANQTGVNNLGNGVNVFAWTVSSASCGTLSDTLVIVNSEMDLQASTQDTIITCAQTGILLEANTPLYGIGTWTTDGAATIADIHSSNTTASLASSGWQYFVWTITNGSCPATTDTLLVLGNLPPDILTPDTTVCLGEEGYPIIGAPAANGTTTSWSVIAGGGEIEDISAPSTMIYNLDYGLNMIVYSSAYPGCPTVGDTLSLVGNLCEGLDPVFPTMITPNFDGKNDLFVINFLEKLYPECHVVIFNRWGSVVFESIGYEEPWDGTYKGEPLPMGTYYYSIELNDDEGTVYRGDISIIH